MEQFQDLDELIQEDAAKPASEDKLIQLRNLGSVVIQQRVHIEYLEEKLKEEKKKLNKLIHEDMPSLFMSTGVDRVGMGKYDLVMQNYYHANIAADWPEDRREAAFQWLEDNKHGDIIRLVVSVSFGRDEYQKAQECVDTLRADGFRPTIQKNVPWTTLTAWLKEQVEKYNRLPPIDLLGATVGKVVKLMERKNG